MRMAGQAITMPMNFAYQRQGPRGWGFYGTRPDLPTTMDAVMAGARTSTLRKGIRRDLQPGAQLLFTDNSGRQQPAVVTGRRMVDPSMAEELSQTELWTPDFLRWYMGNQGLEDGRMEQLLYQLPGATAPSSTAKIYAGIGSRRTPPEALQVMRQLASRMEQGGWLLRSGGAAGADAAFEAGVVDPRHRSIYLPGRSFNQRVAGSGGYVDSTQMPGWQQALESVARYHPAPDRLTPFARNLMARNAFQVLGPTMDRPADLVVAWTPGGQATGGTGQALRMAQDHGIEVRNLGDPAVMARAMRWLQG